MPFPFTFEVTGSVRKGPSGAPEPAAVVDWFERALRPLGATTDRRDPVTLKFSVPMLSEAPKALQVLQGARLEAVDGRDSVEISVHASVHPMTWVPVVALALGAAVLLPDPAPLPRWAFTLLLTALFGGIPYIIAYASFATFIASTCGQMAESYGAGA